MLCCDPTIYDYLWKCIIFLIAYGEIYELLAWKRLASLIKFLRVDFMDLVYYLKDLKMLYLDLWYLGKLIQNFLHKKWVWRLWEACEYLWILKGFVRLLGNELSFEFMQSVSSLCFTVVPWRVISRWLPS